MSKARNESLGKCPCPLFHGEAGHNPAPRTCHEGCSAMLASEPSRSYSCSTFSSPSMSSPWGAPGAFSDLLPRFIPERGRSLRHCKADLSLIRVLLVGPNPLRAGFLGCNQGEPPSWYYPQQGCSPSTGAAPGTPAALQGKSIIRQKGNCRYQSQLHRSPTSLRCHGVPGQAQPVQHPERTARSGLMGTAHKGQLNLM